VLRTAGVSAAVVGGGGLLEACSSSIKGASGGSTSTTGGGGTKDIVIGFIHPLTGALAGFGTSDNWIMTKIAQTGSRSAARPTRLRSSPTTPSPIRTGPAT
jgi:hypothetical protein